MGIRARRSLTVALLLPLLAACGQADTGDPTAEQTPGSAPTPLTVTVAGIAGSENPAGSENSGSTDPASGTTLELAAWSACNREGCYDSAPPTRAPAIGSPQAVRILQPAGLSEVTATFRAMADCGERATDTKLTQDSDGSWTLQPAAGRGSWIVDLWVRSDDASLAVTFAWETPSDGPVPEPFGTLALLANHDGTLDSYGTELMVQGLATSPVQAAATITVTSPDGTVTNWPVEAVTEPTGQTAGSPAVGPACSGRIGELYLTGQETGALAALGSGVTGPYRYDVELTLDGSIHHGSAIWPQDADAQGLSTELTWSPALPGWDGNHPNPGSP